MGLGNLLRQVGLERDAAAHYRRAMDLEPLGPTALRTLMVHLLYTGQSADAYVRLRRSWQTWPETFPWQRFETAALVGNPAEALAMISGPDPEIVLVMGTLSTDEQWRLFLEARIDPSSARIEAATRSIMSAVPANDDIRRTEFIEHLVILGRLDEAYALAMQLPPISNATGRSWFANYMAPFRRDPRFLAFARQQGLYAIWAHTDRWPDFCSTEKLPYRCR